MSKHCLKYMFFALTVLTALSTKSQVLQPDSAVKKMLAKHQVLLTNLAVFKGHKDELQGASAFLINYQDKIFAVTAKHLLGEAMGVTPEINPGDLSKLLLSWKMFPRIPLNTKLDTVKIGAGKLNYQALDRDILLLEVINSNFNILPLVPSFNLPEKGEKLYLIGCPYSQEKCRQNVYEVIYQGYDATESMLKYTIKTTVDLSGFSGAPIVNAAGKVVSILTTGWEDGNIKYAGGTFIKEIQKVQ